MITYDSFIMIWLFHIFLASIELHVLKEGLARILS